MWSLLNKKDEECRRLRDALEEVSTKHADPLRVEGLIERLPQVAREHINSCERCREAAQDLLATKQLFQGAARFGEEERPWFAARVMRAIADRERELALRMSAWSEFPRFASRFAWIATVVLLAGTTWFYERVIHAPSSPSDGATKQESIFETPQQTNQDDVLISMEESNP
jgi:hypothetical protein